MSEKKNPTSQRRPATRQFHIAAREMAARGPSVQLAQALCGMAIFIMNFTPQGAALAHDIYIAIGRAWMNYRHSDEQHNDDDTDRHIIKLHREVLNALGTAHPTDNPKQDNLKSIERDELKRRRARLDGLDCLPENEAVRFKLETDIYRLEHALDEFEWPDEVSDEEGGAS